MSVKLVFLGKLADLAGEPELERPGPLDWHDLLASLDDSLAEALAGPQVRVACNGAVVKDKQTLVAEDGAEVAFLPPVSGG